MEPPYVFWKALASLVTTGAILLGFWVGSLVYKNIMKAHRKTIFVEHHYHNCTFERPLR